MVRVKHRGNFKNTERLFTNCDSGKMLRVLNTYGRIGVQALSAATPIDTGATAASWAYHASVSGGQYTLTWTNSRVTDMGVPVAVLIQFGHASRSGSYVQGRDFINPAVRPVFDAIARELRRTLLE